MNATPPLLRPNDRAAVVLEELRGPLEQRLYGPIAAAGYDAPPPVLTDYPAALDVRYTDRDTTLIAASYDRDPVVIQDGGLIRAPASERRKLVGLQQAGIAPDLVFLVRELPGTWRPGTKPPRMIGVETVATARRLHEQHLQVAAAAHVFGRALLYTTGAALAVLTAGTVALGAVTIIGIGGVAIAAPLEGGLDPIVLGGVIHPDTGGVGWVPLAAWDEIADDRRW